MDGSVSPLTFSQPQASPAPRERLRWTHGLINRLVMLGDALLLVAAPLALAAFSVTGAFGPAQVVVAALLQAAAFKWTLGRMRGYRVEAYRGWRSAAWQLPIALGTSAAVTALLLSAFTALPGPGPGLAWLAAQAAALAGGRAGATLLMRHFGVEALLRRNVVVIGANEVGERVIAGLTRPERAATTNLLAVIRDVSDDPAVEALGAHRVAGGMAELKRLAEGTDVDTVVLALPWSREAAVSRLVTELDWLACDIVVPLQAEESPGSPRVVPLAGGAALQFAGRPLKGSMFITKRIEDIVVASLALLLTSPVILLAAIAIRLESPGPVLFRQPRPGFGRSPFMIYKLRTMTWNPADDGSVGARSRQDPRITRVGAFLRRTSIDELPQFLNVLRGEMSVVGPRPYPVKMLLGDSLFSEAVQRYVARYRIRPGITGLAQVSGMRSAALRDPEMAQRSVQLDMEYIETWSLWLDIQIMVKTALFGLRGRHVF